MLDTSDRLGFALRWLFLGAALGFCAMLVVGIIFLSLTTASCSSITANAGALISDAERIEAIPGYVSNPTLMRQLDYDLTEGQAYIDQGRAQGCS